MALREAKTVLGEGFNAEDASARADIERNITPALAEVEQIGRLASAALFAALRKLSQKEITEARQRIDNIMHEAETLAALAADPARAARTRLYARIAAWMQDHPDVAPDDYRCAVCGGDLREAVDPVTRRPVAEHLHETREQDANLLAQTLQSWAAVTLGALNRDLPPTLQAEIGQELPVHPSGLVRAALIDELFAPPSFLGVLSALKSGVAEACDAVTTGWPQLSMKAIGVLPSKLGGLSSLQTAINRLDRALRFATWRRAHDKEVTTLFVTIIGIPRKRCADPTFLLVSQ